MTYRDLVGGGLPLRYLPHIPDELVRGQTASFDLAGVESPEQAARWRAALVAGRAFLDLHTGDPLFDWPLHFPVTAKVPKVSIAFRLSP